MSIVSKYWMINKTGSELIYQQRHASFDKEKIAAGQSAWEAMKS